MLLRYKKESLAFSRLHADIASYDGFIIIKLNFWDVFVVVVWWWGRWGVGVRETMERITMCKRERLNKQSNGTHSQFGSKDYLLLLLLLYSLVFLCYILPRVEQLLIRVFNEIHSTLILNTLYPFLFSI